MTRDAEPSSSSPAISAPLTVKSAIWLIVTFFAVFITIMSLWLVQAHETARQHSEDQVAAASQVVATNALWISEVARQALRRIDDSMGPSVGRGRADVQDIREAVDSLPGQVKAYVVNQNGDTLYSTDPQIKDVNITDREYFSRLANGEPSYVSSLMVSRLNNTQIFVFSRRLERNGQFAGAAIISFDVALLADIWTSLDLGESSTISLVRDDGQLVARYPFAPGPVDMSDYVLFTDYLPSAPAGIYLAISPVDGIERLVSYRKVEGTNFIAIASMHQQTAMAGFWRNAVVTLLFALPTALGLGGASLWITQLLQRDAKRNAELAGALEANNLLLREIHHRVKNNLQSIQSLVRIQDIPDDAKTDLRGRIGAMAAVHEHIYTFDQFADVDAGEMLKSVVSALVDTRGRNIEVKYDLEPIIIKHEQATPLALVANEVVTNCLKYAFSDGRQGSIRIDLHKTGEQSATLVIADSGTGFDPSVAREGMGSKLIRGVVAQLDGTYRYDIKDGTIFTLDFALHSREGK